MNTSISSSRLLPFCENLPLCTQHPEPSMPVASDKPTPGGFLTPGMCTPNLKRSCVETQFGASRMVGLGTRPSTGKQGQGHSVGMGGCGPGGNWPGLGGKDAARSTLSRGISSSGKTPSSFVRLPSRAANLDNRAPFPQLLCLQAVRFFGGCTSLPS